MTRSQTSSDGRQNVDSASIIDTEFIAAWCIATVCPMSGNSAVSSAHIWQFGRSHSHGLPVNLLRQPFRNRTPNWRFWWSLIDTKSLLGLSPLCCVRMQQANVWLHPYSQQFLDIVVCEIYSSRRETQLLYSGDCANRRNSKKNNATKRQIYIIQCRSDCIETCTEGFNFNFSN